MPSNRASGGSLKVVGGYELQEKLGAGAMGAVYKARQVSLDRIVALKLLPPKIAQDKVYIERFQREARACGNLNHQNIVQGIDVGRDDKTGLWYFAMEFVDGPTLKQVMKDEGKLDEQRVRGIAKEMAQALAYANKHGFVHRDIKPDNILLTSNGVSKLADLGLAKRLEGGDDAHLTQEGKAVGTPYYMSPEQVRGDQDKIDIRSDIYALGATFFHLLTGEVPFKGRSGAETMSMHLTEKVPLAHKRVAGVSEPFSRVLADMMSKDQEGRPSTPEALLERLERLDQNRSVVRETRGQKRITGGPHGRVTTGPQRRITTGPRGRVSDRRERLDGDTGPQRKTGSPLPIIAGVGAVVVLGVVAFMFAGGSTPTPKTGKKEVASTSKKKATSKTASDEPTKVTPKEAAPSPEEKLQAEWEGLQAFEKNSPNAFTDLRARYDSVAKLAAAMSDGAEWKKRIAEARNTLDERFRSAVDGAWKKLVSASDTARKEGNYDEALKVLAPPSDFANDLSTKVSELKAKILEEANGRVAELKQQIVSAMETGKWEAAEAALAKLTALKFAPATAAATALKQKVAQMREAAKADEARLADQARAYWVDQLKRFDEQALEKRDLASARQVALEIDKDPKLAALKAERAALRQVVDAFAKIQKAETDAVAGLKGREVDWTVKGQHLKGKVVKVRADSVMVEAGPVTLQVKLSDLSEEQRAGFVPKLNPETNGERVAAAILRLAKPAQDWKAAKELLTPIAEDALAKHYLKHARKLEMGEVEVAAEDAWKNLQKKCSGRITVERAKELLGEVQAFIKTYEETNVYKQNEKEILALRKRLNAASRVNLVVNGDFEAGEKSWEKDLQSHTKLTIEPGDGVAGPNVAHIVCSSDGGRTAAIRQPLQLEPGQWYVASLRVMVPRITGDGLQREGGQAKDLREVRLEIVNGPQDKQVATRKFRLPTKEWKRLGLRFRATEAKPTLTISAFKQRQGDFDLLIDDVKLIRLKSGEVPKANNLMRDGGFEAGTLEGWRVEDHKGGKGSTEIVKEGARGGDQALKVRLDSGRVSVRYVQTVRNHVPYVVAFWIKVLKFTGQGKPPRINVGSHGQVSQKRELSATAVGSWMCMRYRYTPHRTNLQITFEKHPRGMGAEILVDDVQIICKEKPKEKSPGVGEKR